MEAWNDSAPSIDKTSKSGPENRTTRKPKKIETLVRSCQESNLGCRKTLILRSESGVITATYMVISGGKLEVGICEDVHYKTDGNLGITTYIMTLIGSARSRWR